MSASFTPPESSDSVSGSSLFSLNHLTLYRVPHSLIPVDESLHCVLFVETQGADLQLLHELLTQGQHHHLFLPQLLHYLLQLALPKANERNTS